MDITRTVESAPIVVVKRAGRHPRRLYDAYYYYYYVRKYGKNAILIRKMANTARPRNENSRTPKRVDRIFVPRDLITYFVSILCLYVYQECDMSEEMKAETVEVVITACEKFGTDYYVSFSFVHGGGPLDRPRPGL